MSDEALQQMPEFRGGGSSMIKLNYLKVFSCTLQIDILLEIGCIDDDLIVQIKGCIAGEMNSGDEFICTECLFKNRLDVLEPEEEVALMSTFVFQQRNTTEPLLLQGLCWPDKDNLMFLIFRKTETYFQTVECCLIQIQNIKGKKIGGETPGRRISNQALFWFCTRQSDLVSFRRSLLPIASDEYAQENLKFRLVEVLGKVSDSFVQFVALVMATLCVMQVSQCRLAVR
ncbi:ATP-dependent RNA helicase Ski2, C-terminal [Dillenia turbinata]|uniref:ATP-dependent RNA helicase Ski2, C-terminal n=1 Tax=Dillenia turbinata TaxID=194707 RepID=A0AAN8VBJ7_9MAGN